MKQANPSDKCVEQMRAYCNVPGKPHTAHETVNTILVGQWCDAVGDRNPIYQDEKIARSLGWPDIVAPPAMLNTWTMPGNVSHEQMSDDPFLCCIRICDEAGYTGVVATNSNHEYLDYLKMGDALSATQIVSEISTLKTTALGTGYFITTNTDFFVEKKLVGRMLFRIFKYRPGSGRQVEGSGNWRLRPRPAISRDTAFFWEGLKQGELRIQQCTKCSQLHHPPMVRCPACGSYDLGHKVSKGTGTLYSYVEPHHPVLPFMRQPYVVGLVELSEGTRIISNIINCPPSQLKIGMKLKLSIEAVDPELSLPMFSPNPPIKREQTLERRESTLGFDALQIGDELPDWDVAITPTLIVSGALASRDFYEVHHDRDAAQKRGAKDIFTNIMTTQALCARYINDWCGPGAHFRSLHTQLGAPNYPGDTMRMRAYISDKSSAEKEQLLTFTLKGENKLGDHVNAVIVVHFPDK
jgi:uncharacterized OB-fold protein/acyl dehydratase